MAAFAILAFIGTMAQHLVGGLLYEVTVGFVGGLAPAGFAGFWRVIFFLYPEERLTMVAISTVLAAAIFRSYQRFAPPSWRD